MATESIEPGKDLLSALRRAPHEFDELIEAMRREDAAASIIVRAARRPEVEALAGRHRFLRGAGPANGHVLSWTPGHLKAPP